MSGGVKKVAISINEKYEILRVFFINLPTSGILSNKIKNINTPWNKKVLIE